MKFIKFWLIILAIIGATSIACNGTDNTQYDTPPSCDNARGCA